MLHSIETILIAAFVTAAVTFAPGGGSGGAQAQPSLPYFIVITNLDTKHTAIYKQRVFPGTNTCDAAILGINERLRSFADVKPIEDAPNADPVILEAVNRLVAAIITNTGKLPNLTISCETTAVPK